RQPQDGLVVLHLFEIGQLRAPIHFRPSVGPTFGGIHATRPVAASHRSTPFIPSTMVQPPHTRRSESRHRQFSLYFFQVEILSLCFRSAESPPAANAWVFFLYVSFLLSFFY